MDTTYLHIDCNTFFASCEVATNPGLAGKPVVVANDNEVGGGIILALTKEAKALGLQRGQPLFQVRRIIENNGVTLCKCDHNKYRRISAQIMNLVKEQEVVLDFVQYSVDEFFGQLPLSDPDEIRHYTKMVKDHITSNTGIPVSCGCSQSYTLAKTATHFAKQYPAYHGICVLPPDKRKRALQLTKINEVWGIGRQSVKQLMLQGVATAADFAGMEGQRVRSLFSTALYNTYKELNGIPSITLRHRDLQQSISQSHTFGVMLGTEQELEAPIRGFVSHCATRLRSQKGTCDIITLFLSTNRHRQDLPQYSNSAFTRLPAGTNDTPLLTKAALRLLHEIFRPGYLYKQAGVILGGIEEDDGHQLDLFTAQHDERRRKLMEITDTINKKYGTDSIGFIK
ncbi:MAG: Y-family DNA polymerase [Bacteroidales bacterium]|nr:Y-family DNA polymerase [Bacteroidales bacterium]